MKPPAPDSAQRIRTLIETGLQEARYLRRTDDRLFAPALSLDAVSQLPKDDDLSERIDAFVARFGRLQDTIGDKLLPAFLGLMQETPATMLENLDRAAGRWRLPPRGSDDGRRPDLRHSGESRNPEE